MSRVLLDKQSAFMENYSFKLGPHEIGTGRCFIIGEIAQAHDGSLGMAHAYIDAIANAGADAVKFQTHIAEAESSLIEPWRVKFSRQDKTRFEYWKRMEFSPEQWAGLKEHAEDKGLVFLSSPFSIQACELLENMGVVAWKVASGELCNSTLLTRMAETGKGVLLSSGMNSLEELDMAVEIVRKSKSPFAVLQCTSSYPTPPEKIGLNMLEVYRTRYSCPVGLSDHSGTAYAGLAAVALGTSILEVHVTMSREMFGPDVVASITTSELSNLVAGTRFIERINNNPVDKNSMAADFEGMRSIFMKSLFLTEDLDAGVEIQSRHLEEKKPGIGILSERKSEILGKKLRVSRKKGWMLTDNDLDL